MSPQFLVLESAVDVGALSTIDVEFSKMLFHSCSEQNEEVAALICHLTKSSREGHLCIKMENDQLFPSTEEIWLRDCSESPSKELLNLLEKIPNAFHSIPSSILSEVDSDTNVYPEEPICRFKNYLYLQKNWVFETHFIHHLNQLCKGLPELIVDENRVLKLCEDYTLNEKQNLAVKQAFNHRLSVISGGPGTGKTYTAGSIVSLFTQIFQEPNLKIALTAPTGKAASKLRSSLGEINHAQVDALTLHSLLNLTPESPYQYPPEKILPYDLIIVDECSMIDVKLMASLLPSIKQGARILFLGDPDQLPSVEAGSLLADMICALDKKVIVHLEECLRVELQDLVSFAQEINQGSISAFPDCVVHITPSSESIWKQGEELIQGIIKHFPSSFSTSKTEDVFGKFRVLSPLRNGLMGVNTLNEKLLYLAHQQTVEGNEYAVPIMIVRNHPKRELFNGETGFLVRKKRKTPFDMQKDDYALFGDRKIPAFLLPAFEYAFCMSVHKSQGSEFDHIFLVLPQGSEWFGREMLYTAVTRAKKKLTIWGDESVIQPTLNNRCQRYSGVVEKF